MTGGKKIIEGLQDAVAHARASNSDLARLRALAEAAAKARAHHRKVQRASKTTPLESRQSVVALEDAVRAASEAMERDVPALLDRLEAAEARVRDLEERN
jgi:hypothetical protein